VGVNDFWNRPRLHSLAEAKGARPSGSFPLRWRTGRLVSLLRERLRPIAGGGGDNPGGEAAVFLGEWHLGRVPLRFERDGRLSIWPREFRWSIDGDRLTVADAGGWHWEARWRKAAGGIELCPVQAGGAFLLEAGPLPGYRGGPLGAHVHFRFNEGLDALHRGDLPQAIETFEAICRHSPDYVHAPGALAYALVKAGRAAEAAELRERLARLYEQGRDPRVFEAAMTALAPLPEEAGARRALAADFVAHTGEGLASFSMLAAQGFLGHDLPSARGLVEEVLALLPPEAAERRANLLRARAHLLARGDPAGALRDVVEAFRLDGAEPLAAQAILSHPESFSADVLARGLRSPDVDPRLGRRLEEVFGESRGEEGPAMKVLEGHLREIVALCRERGARPALVSYCLPMPLVEPVQERISRETGAPWVHVRLEFDRRLARARREDLVARGGHPNNAGYGVVAKLVADEVLRSMAGR
ncbi:MAG TPA: tetratricopeptide repeat protein, partial [Planctomycetota bacterium]|nr:tetratricopeptide repeat protein [Planctomycetota bacterium]